MTQQFIDATKLATLDTNLTGGAVADPEALQSVIDDFAAKINNNAGDAASKTQESWITPTMINAWVNLDTSLYNGAGYYKDNFGIVHLRGLIKGGTTSTNIFVLPAGYRPLKRLVMSTLSNSTTDVASRLDVFADGSVQALGGSGNTYLTLEGISFKAEQ